MIRRTNATCITWIRDPIERLASHYNYWKRTYDPATARPLHRRCIEEGWSLERFYFSPEIQNLYTQYLWGFSLQRFDFVGVFEHREEDYRYFQEQILQEPLPMYAENVNPYRSERKYVTDPVMRKRLEIFHSGDMELYYLALAMRERRMHKCKELLDR